MNKHFIYISIIILFPFMMANAQSVLGPNINRKALVAPDCIMDKVVSVVGVGTGTTNLNNMLDADLNNSTTFINVVGAGVTLNPVVSIKDQKNTYAAGTTAGFCVVAGSGGSVLSLDIVKAMTIMVYNKGILQETLPTTEGQNVQVLGLNLIQLPGSGDAVVNLTVTPTVPFDEICLALAGGVNIGVGTTLSVKYAFVGNAVQNNLTTSGMSAINGTVSASGLVTTVLLPTPILNSELDKMLDTDLTNGTSIVSLVAVAFQGSVKLTTNKVFKAGSEVGFKYTDVNVLNLKVGAFIKIKLYDQKDNVVQDETISASVLGLAVGSGGLETVSIISKADFSKAELEMWTGLSIEVAGRTIHYGFVREKPEVANQCDLRLSMNTSICGGQTYYQLLSNPATPVTWSLLSSPSSAVSVSPGGTVQNMDATGIYKFKAVTTDGCTDSVTITKGITYTGDGYDCQIPVIGESSYELSSNIYSSSGSLISISDLNNPGNILNANLDDYASYIKGLSLISDLRIIGVKSKNASLMSDGTEAKRIGFVLESSVTGVGANLLQFYQIRTYKNGVETYSHTIDETNAVSIGLIGSNKSQKTRYSINVPSGIEFDEYMLWTAGVLSLQLSELRIYYAFIEPGGTTECNDPLGCSAEVISQSNTGAYFNYDAMKVVSLVSAGATIVNLGNMIDNDRTTATNLQGVKVGAGTVIAVKTGRTMDQSDQLTILIDKKSYLAGVNAGNWLTVETYYRNVKTVDVFTNWDVLGANVIGYGDQSLLLMSPTVPYDEVRMTFGQIASVLDGANIYGLFIRHDVDGDGLPDCRDNDSCHDDIQNVQIAPICEGQSITITGKAYRDTPYVLNMPDQGKSVPFRTNAIDGSFSVTINNLTTTGRFNLTFVDGSGIIVGTAAYIVHPLLTQWLQNAVDTNWNNWNNWSKGSPYCCTNVIIPSNAVRYPVLGSLTGIATENCCNYIHFEPNAEVVKTNKLTYTKAWIELALTPNRYYMLSAPLKNMYTGDFFVPISMNGIQNNAYFTALAQSNSPESRFNPRIYQRLWSTSAPGKFMDGTSTSVAVTETRWSQHFNALKYNYPNGTGLSLWVDNNKLPANTLFKFRFPKEHTGYTYYDELGNATNVVETNLDRTQSGRFIYENNDHTSTLPLSVLLTNAGAASTYFLVGNPFMSHIDVAKFLQQNQSVISALKVYDGNTNNTVIDVNGQLVSNGPDFAQIAPMQSFFVVAKTAATTLAVTFTEDMLVSAPTSYLKSDSNNEQLKITANAGGNEASTIILTNGDTGQSESGLEMLLDNEIKPSIALFSLQENQAFDILSANRPAEIPLGMYLSGTKSVKLRFTTDGGGSITDEYVLKDQSTGIEYPMDQEISLPDITSNIGRFVLHNRSVATSMQEIENKDVYVELMNHQALVRSATKDIDSIEVYNLNGQRIYLQSCQSSREASAPLGSGINLLKVTFTDRSTQNFKLIGSW